MSSSGHWRKKHSLPSWPGGLPLLALKARTARTSPDRFIEFCITDATGAPLHQAAVHSDLQSFLSCHRRAQVELPRDHGKTLQVCGRLVWELGRNPALRVRLVCATEALALERGRFLREAIAGNPRVRIVFPGLRPAQPWQSGSFTVVRSARSVGPTLAAVGVGAGSIGARADLLVCDDIVDVRALHSRSERERVKDAFHNNLMNLLEPDGRVWCLSTPWHNADLNADLRKNPAYVLFRRGVGADLSPVWPEKWPRERLAERRAEIGEAAFSRGYRLLAVDPGEVTIRPEWIQFWTDRVEVYDRFVLAVDPAVSASASADASALIVAGRVGAVVHCLAALARRVTAPDLVALIDQLDRTWKPDVILFESNAAFAGIRDLLRRQTRFGSRIQGVTQSRSKAARLAAFAVAVQAGSFLLEGIPGGGPVPGQRELFEEMSTIPFAPHDDLTDAAAMATADLLDRPEPRVWL